MEAGSYEEAETIFSTLIGYKDSNDKASACKAGIIDQKYNSAVV